MLRPEIGIVSRVRPQRVRPGDRTGPVRSGGVAAGPHPPDIGSCEAGLSLKPPRLTGSDSCRDRTPGCPTAETESMTHTAERGRISLFFVLVFLFLLALVPAGVLVVRMTDRAAPRVTVKTEAKAIGRKALVTVEAEEPKYGIRDVHAFLVQGSLNVPLGELTNPRNPWWRLWRRQVKPSALLEVEVGKGRAPELKEGPVTIR